MISANRTVFVTMGLYSLSITAVMFYVVMDRRGHTGYSENTTPKVNRNPQETEYDTMALCDDYPTTLIGKLDINASFVPTEKQAIDVAGEIVKEGCYEPRHCISNQTVAIIIPYKNRKDNLIALLHHLHPILQRQDLRYCVFVVEQYDDGAFNKARIMNAGFIEILAMTKFPFDCIVLHDVDMLMEDDRNLYKCGEVPLHLSPAIDKFHYKIGYGTRFGGVGAVSVSQYLLVNGHSNRFYGWGGEDSDIELRYRLNGIKTEEVDGKYGRYKMIPHDHPWTFNPKTGLGSYVLTRANTKRFDIDHQLLKRSDGTGLSTIKYAVKNVSTNNLYTKINIDVRTHLINYVAVSLDKFVTKIEAENPSITNIKYNTDRNDLIKGFGIEAGEEFPNYECYFDKFEEKTVNRTLGLVLDETLTKYYDNLEHAKSICVHATIYCASVLEVSPGRYTLRPSAYMHENTLTYVRGRIPRVIFTERHKDISVYVKICPKDTRYLQILSKPAILHNDDMREKLSHEAIINLQLYQVEDFKLYYTYSISSAHKALIEDSEMFLNKSLGIYDSLSVTHSNSVLLFDSQIKKTFERFLPTGYHNLEQLSRDEGVIQLKTRSMVHSLLPGCYVCNSFVKDHLGGIHMKWRWWFEVRGETKALEERLQSEHLRKAKVASTRFTEELGRRYGKSLHLPLPGGIQFSDEVLNKLLNKLAS